MALLRKVKTVRVAVVGCGSFGNKHLDNLLKMENVEVIALYNRSVERLEETGKKVPKARLYQDMEKMLSKENIDAVIVALSPNAHGEIEELCCKKGIHMFVEKPIGLEMDQLKKINEKIKFANIITSVGYQERYNPVLDTIKEILEKEPVGLVSGYWCGFMPATKAWRTKAISGGQIIEQTTHIIDMLRYLFGEADSVYMNGGKNSAFDCMENDVAEYSGGIINFKNGVVASLQTSCYAKDKGATKVGFEIIMPRCIIRYKWGSSVTIVTKELTKEINFTEGTHYPCLATFIEAVRTGDRYLVKSSYEDALKSIEISIGADKSMETGEVVKCDKIN